MRRADQLGLRPEHFAQSGGGPAESKSGVDAPEPAPAPAVGKIAKADPDPPVDSSSIDEVALVGLLRQLRGLVEERANTYATFASGLAIFRTSQDVPAYQRLCAAVTARFQELSRAVNAVEKRLVAGGQERWGRRVRRLQQLEQRKFRATVQLQVLRAEEALRGQAGLSSLLAPAVPAAADDDVEGDVDGGSAGRGARATGGAGAGAGVDKGSLLRELQAVAGQLAPELERLRVRVMGEGDDVDGDADGLSDGWDDDEADGPAG